MKAEGIQRRRVDRKFTLAAHKGNTEMEQLSKLAMLLDVVHKAAAAGPAYVWIVNLADAEIAKMKLAASVVEPAPVHSGAVVPSSDFQTFNKIKSSAAPSGQDSPK